MSRPRPLAGLLLSASLAAGALLTLLAPTSCGSDAVGIDECRTIETARCEAATACGFTPEKVESCTSFYRDECLHGVENADAGAPAATAVEACVAAVNATAACAKAGAKTVAGCAGVKVIAGADVTLAPCVVLQSKVDLLAACAFATLPPTPDAGATDAAADAK
ncbi:MAG: hypothetical protein ABJE95_04565 [Byssovorax sp.]